MMSKFAGQVRAALAFFAVTALLAFGSCSDSSPAPTPIQIANPGPATPAIVNLEMDAPETVAPGATAQLTVRALKSDGSSESLTSGVVWTSNRSNVLQVDAQGVVTGRSVGETAVTARYSGRSASRGILVVPTGTYRLSGQVTEEGVPITSASVTVIAGTGEGLSTVTDNAGSYRLYGVAGSIKLHIKKAGYQNLTQDVHVGGHISITGSMVPERPRDALGGQYRLTLTASGCSNIPSEWTRRTYDATVQQDGARMTVTLTGADFIMIAGKGNSFTGIYGGDGSIVFGLGFPMQSPYYYYYYYLHMTADVVERMSETSALVIHGRVASKHDGNGRIAGFLDGSFNITTRLTSSVCPYASTCRSSTHSFELRRR